MIVRLRCIANEVNRECQERNREAQNVKDLQSKWDELKAKCFDQHQQKIKTTLALQEVEESKTDLTMFGLDFEKKQEGETCMLP